MPAQSSPEPHAGSQPRGWACGGRWHFCLREGSEDSPSPGKADPAARGALPLPAPPEALGARGSRCWGHGEQHERPGAPGVLPAPSVVTALRWPRRPVCCLSYLRVFKAAVDLTHRSALQKRLRKRKKSVTFLLRRGTRCLYFLQAFGYGVRVAVVWHIYKPGLLQGEIPAAGAEFTRHEIQVGPVLRVYP